MRVLIVEDDRRLANMLRLGLEEEGLAVDAVGDGEHALAAASTTTFDGRGAGLNLRAVSGRYSLGCGGRRNTTLPHSAHEQRDSR